MEITGVAVFVDDGEGLVDVGFGVEVHFDVDAVRADGIE